jgi:hypothetical protein
VTLPARFSLLQSDLNDFLFASVGAGENGMPLSVLSALTRLGVDPWEEAARLAALPRTRAAAALARLIAQLPAEQSASVDSATATARLVELLPLNGGTAAPSREFLRVTAEKRVQVTVWLACLGLGTAALCAFF